VIEQTPKVDQSPSEATDKSEAKSDTDAMREWIRYLALATYPERDFDR
jgi:hypothetical protein